MGDTFWNGIYPFIDYSTGGSIDGMIAACDANLAATTDKTIIIPGHGKARSNKAELQDFRDMLAAIRDNVAALKKQGRSRDETVAAKPTAAFDAKFGNSSSIPASSLGWSTKASENEQCSGIALIRSERLEGVSHEGCSIRRSYARFQSSKSYMVDIPPVTAVVAWPRSHPPNPPRTPIRMRRPPVTHHRIRDVDGVKIFYREAGPEGAPVVLLLHGFPTSSHMFRNLIPALADRYRVIAPDYPGYGQSDMPDRATFDYTFDRYADLVDGLLDQLGVSRTRCTSWTTGACRLATGPKASRADDRPHRAERQRLRRRAERVLEADQGLLGRPLGRHRKALHVLVAPEITKFQYTDGVSDVSRIAPDTWVYDQVLLDRPGNVEIQMDLFYDYRTNLPLYPEVHAYFRKHQPPTLIVWGKNDKIFPADGAHPYKRDLPKRRISPHRHRPLRA